MSLEYINFTRWLLNSIYNVGVQNMHVCAHFRALGVPKRQKRDKKEAKRGSKNTKSPISKQYDVIEVLKLHQMIAKFDI